MTTKSEPMYPSRMPELTKQLSQVPKTTVNNNYPWTPPEERVCLNFRCKKPPIENTSYGYAFCEFHAKRAVAALGWELEHLIKKDEHFDSLSENIKA